MTDASRRLDPAASHVCRNTSAGTVSRSAGAVPGRAAAAIRGAHQARSASGVSGGNSCERSGSPARVASGVRSRCVPTTTVAPDFAARRNPHHSSAAGTRSASSQYTSGATGSGANRRQPSSNGNVGGTYRYGPGRSRRQWSDREVLPAPFSPNNCKIRRCPGSGGGGTSRTIQNGSATPGTGSARNGLCRRPSAA
ncbi:hypothetical protein CA12_20380 [Alienimonas californiensis]|uniref:Uncharacterized protein n=1 Tax=Alienimonas californiensis TaxID=2527989 RepID=A0A517P989_9PLAN|nr:hypothetical protein CA12_20380 [Alienimonas californiensis]